MLDAERTARASGCMEVAKAPCNACQAMCIRSSDSNAKGLLSDSLLQHNLPGTFQTVRHTAPAASSLPHPQPWRLRCRQSQLRPLQGAPPQLL